MWYVIQVRTGQEEKIKMQCQKNIASDVLRECFIPYYEEQKHIKGKWETQKKILFSGYVFLDTEEIMQLYADLKQVSGLTKLLKTGEEVIPLTEKEMGFLDSFGGQKKIVSVSEGIIENAKIIIKSGPLVGMERYIRKIDWHKRRAFLEVPMFGGIQRVQVGLEIVSKT